MIKVISLKDINKTLNEGDAQYECEPQKPRKFETQLNTIRNWGESRGYELMTFYYYEQMNFVFNDMNKILEKKQIFSD